MRRSSLGLVLIALNVSLALVAVAGLAGAAAALLRRFTDEQALERVRVAAISAERGIAAQGEALATITRLLAAAPDPPDALATSSPRRLAAYLDRLRTAAGRARLGEVRR